MLFSPCIICFLGFVFPSFFSSHPNVATAVQRGVTWATCFPLASAAISSKSGMSGKLLLLRETFGNLWAITGVREAWSVIRGLKCNQEPRSPWAAQRETDWLVLSLDLAPLHRASDWMTPATRRKLYPVPTYELSNQSKDCHMFNRREEKLKVGSGFLTTCGSLAQVATFSWRLIWQCLYICLSSDQLFERIKKAKTVTETESFISSDEGVDVSTCAGSSSVRRRLPEFLHYCDFFSQSVWRVWLQTFSLMKCIGLACGLKCAVQGETRQAQTM